jgi:precorrin-6Y C5,15-methyltransferase (decarboxylating)
MTAITVETLAAVTAYYAARHDYILDITQVMTARSRHIGSSHMMMAQNPVYIMTAVCKTAPDGERRTSCPQ